ncbi:MAG: 30S ribosomal protein S6 [bacterium]|nr:30S ribosomal protein S6 [bacterium]
MTDEIVKSETPVSLGSAEEAVSRIYEVGYLIVPTVSEEELPREVTALKDVLEKEKVAIIAEDFPKLRPLAYPIQKRAGGVYQKHMNAYFGWVKFESSPESVLRIDQAFKQSEKVLRYILIKTVREHTLTMGRLRTERRERKEAPKDATPAVPVSETELDKSIEKLIAE